MNKKLAMASVIAALSLAGCTLIGGGSAGDSALPQVSLANDVIRVHPEPLRFPKNQKDVTIVWQLPKGSALRFAPNGIVIEGELTNRLIRGARDPNAPGGRAPDSVVLDPDQKEIVDCRSRSDGLEFTCLNRHTRPGIFKYTIRLVQAGRSFELDPTAMND